MDTETLREHIENGGRVYVDYRKEPIRCYVGTGTLDGDQVEAKQVDALYTGGLIRFVSEIGGVREYASTVERVECPACFGVEEDEPCDTCKGRGYFLRKRPAV